MAERIIADRYELESKIGSGGMGTVWKAHDTLLDRTVAVKILHEGLAEDANFAERFRREARNAASLGHPNVVTVYDTGEDAPSSHSSDAVPFIVMEYVDGESLHRLLSRQGPLPVEDTARIARSILAALDHAHSRFLVHRDMKPANVLMDSASGECKVVDFGIAKGLEETGGLTRTSGLIGTAAYLSPEQVSGHDATARSDLYAAGCLLYACLTGQPPFSGSTPVAIAMRHLNDSVPPLRRRRPDVPPELEAIVMRALEKDPARRYASAREMDAAVAATGLDRRPSSEPTVVAATAAASTVAMQQHPVGGRVVPGTEVLAPASSGPGPANARWLAAVAAALVAAALATVLVLWLQSRNAGELVEAPLPSAITPTPTVAPTEPPKTEKPKETKTPEATRTPAIDLPGIQLPGPDDDASTPIPTPSPSPSPSPTADGFEAP